MTHGVSRFTFHALLFTLGLFLAACAQQSGEPRPPTLAIGRDVCDACGMIISEAKFAAATVTADGKTLKFDDAGEMFSYHAKNANLQVRGWFVHDYNSQQWIPGTTAFYVVAKDVKSPMGTGVVAFGDKNAAETFAAKYNAKILSFDEVRMIKPSM